MKSLVGAFLAVMAINSAPGLSAATATYLTVLAALLAVVVYVAVRGRRKHATTVAPPTAVPGPTIVQHIYTTQPVFTGVYHPGVPTPQPLHVPSERAGQVILPDSIYQRSPK